MSRLITQVPPPNADDPVQRGRCAIATSWRGADLPDMLDAATETSPSTAAPTGPATDELLSQMAGKEIDRLLADAGVEQPAGAEQPASASPASTIPSSSSPTDEAVNSAATTEAPAVVVAKAEAAAGALGTTTAAMIAADAVMPSAGDISPSAALITSELDQIVARQLAEAVLGDVAKNKSPAGDSAKINSSAAPESDSSAVPDLLDRLEAGERQSPPSANPASETPPPEPAPAVASASAPTTDSAADVAPSEDPMEIRVPGNDAPEPSLFSRVLDLAALPLDPFPAPLRDLIGKIAIVTTINAAAVLIYVTFFRK